MDGELAQTFEAARPRLLGLAYRILGSIADAEDAVQDTFMKWAKADTASIDNATAWLMTTCTRRCLDLTRAGHRARVSYVGAWLPEPIQTTDDGDAAANMDLAASLKTAFLLMLDRLTPKERAAYLLHHVFEMPYGEIAATLGMQESACRKLVSRAKAQIDQAKVRHRTPAARQQQLFEAFQGAVTSGAMGPLAALLADDVQLSTDGGGKVPAARDVLLGKDAVTRFVTRRLYRYWADLQWLPAEINGSRGAVLKDGDATAAAVSFAYDEAGRVTGIFIMRNPEKLAGLGAVAIH